MQRAKAREWLQLVLFGGLVALALTLAYMTSHLDSALWVRAQNLPGPLGGFFQTWHARYSYRPPPVPPGARVEDGVIWVEREKTTYVHPRAKSPETPASPEKRIWEEPTREWVWTLPGIVVRQTPQADAAALATLDRIAQLPRHERRGDWFRVTHQGQQGWVLLPGYREDGGPPLGDAPEPPGPLFARVPDRAQVDNAIGGLELPRLSRRWGQIEVHTDLPAAEDFLAELESIVTRLDGVYAARHGLKPVGEARAAVVIFRHEQAYRNFQERSAALLGLPAAGHNDRGLVALFQGDRAPAEVASTLVHELTHLLNRRAVGPQLPPWLDEGLAEDLAMSRLENGRIETQNLGGEISERRHARELERHFTGAYSSLFNVRSALLAKKLPEILKLTGFDWPAFVRSGDRRLHYDQAALWVRFLVEADGGRYRSGWQRFLSAVAAGEQPGLEQLCRQLGLERDGLEAHFHAWIFDLANHRLGPP